MAKLNITQAARDWSIARSTLQRAIKSGKVSIHQDGNGAKYIDSSEMIRVYGAARQQRDVAKSVTRDTSGSSDTVHKLELYKVHYRYLKRENELQKDRINHLEKVIESQREMLMIMHRRLPKKQ